jgi:hypothetical protein
MDSGIQRFTALVVQMIVGNTWSNARNSTNSGQAFSHSLTLARYRLPCATAGGEHV